MIPTIYMYYFLYSILILLIVFLFITFVQGLKTVNNKVGKLLVIWASFTVIASTIIFVIFASKIIWRDIKYSIDHQSVIRDIND